VTPRVTGRRGGRGEAGGFHGGEQAADRAAEAVALGELVEEVPVGRDGRGGLVVEPGRDRDHQAHRLQVLLAPPERGGQPGRQAVPGGDQRIEAGELGHQAGRGLLPHPGDAGQAVGRVAPQGREVDVAPRRHAALGPDRRLVHVDQVGGALAREQHGHHRVADELEQVAVTGDDRHPLLGAGGGGDRADHVVGLVAGSLRHGQAGRVEHRPDDRELAGQLWRVLGPLGLVARVGVDPPLRAPVRVEDVHHPLGPVVDQ